MKIKITLILLCFSLLLFSQDYPKKKIGDKEYYVYTVEAGEGLFAISKKFDVSQAEIITANPNIDNGLRAGQTIYIPIAVSYQTSVNQLDNSKKYFEHKVAAQQTFYSICKMYNVSQEEVLALNQGLEPTQIKIGQVIKIPVEAKQREIEKNITNINVDKKNKFTYYEVKNKKESLYSISKTFGVSINEILEANPDVENGIKKGDIIKVPVNETIENQQQKQKNGSKDKSENELKNADETVHIVQPKETIYGISKQYDVPQEDLISANPQLKDGLKVGQTLIIPKENKITVEASNPKKEIEPIVVPELSKKYLKIAFLLPFTNSSNENTNVERFINFYKGALLALEEAKKQGFSADVQVFDTGVGTTSFNRILSEKFLANADLIIGPAYTDQVSIVAAFAKKNKIAQVVPFTSKIDKADKHDYLYQFNPASEDIEQAAIEGFIEKFENYNIIFINFSDKNDKGAKFADNLKKNLRLQSIKFTEISNDDAIIQTSKVKKNIVIFATSNYENITNILPNIKKSNNNILEYWVSDEIKDKLPELENCYSYSMFNNNVSENYLQQYKKWFGNRTCNSTPCYDLLGYDIVYYFCNADFNALTSTFSGRNSILFQQSNFNFMPQKNGKGFINYGYFLNCNSCK